MEFPTHMGQGPSSAFVAVNATFCRLVCALHFSLRVTADLRWDLYTASRVASADCLEETLRLICGTVAIFHRSGR